MWEKCGRGDSVHTVYIDSHFIHSLHISFRRNLTFRLSRSFMSAITLLGTPAEVYQYGTQYIMIGFSYLLVMPAAAYLYMPVFFDLQLISVYEVSYHYQDSLSPESATDELAQKKFHYQIRYS